MRVAEIQACLVQQGLDGWLFYDFRHTNPIAYRALELDDRTIATRRWYYYVPREGTPTGLVSALEAGNLDSLPGEKLVYKTWEERRAALERILRRGSSVAMEYSPLNAVPYISRVDAGTIELVRSLGVNVVSSADLVQMAVARWTDEQWQCHRQASERLMAIKDRAFAEAARCVASGLALTDYQLQQFMVGLYRENGLVADDPPIVATNAHCSNPHYLPTATRATPIQRGDTLLIDFWAKLDQPRAVYADHTWMAFVGDTVPEKLAEVFAVATGARDEAIAFVSAAFRHGRVIRGWEVDDIARSYVLHRGYGDYFIHRTGHSIDEEVHGEGANMDNYETHDERVLMERTCFSIEPGIYLSEFGVRTEVDVFIADGGNAIVTGAPIQTEVVPLLA